MGFIELIREGGFIMYPLLLCSVMIWAVVFEKMWSLTQFKKQADQLLAKASLLVRDNKINEAKGLFHTAHPLIGAPSLAVLEEYIPKEEIWTARITRELRESQQGLRRFMWILGTIGSAAPFIGLFGTVVGIIKSFESMARTGKGGFSVVAAGLSEALIATAAGIFVAVMAVVFFNFFQSTLAIVNMRFSHLIETLTEDFRIYKQERSNPEV